MQQSIGCGEEYETLCSIIWKLFKRKITWCGAESVSNAKQSFSNNVKNRGNGYFNVAYKYYCCEWGFYSIDSHKIYIINLNLGTSNTM